MAKKQDYTYSVGRKRASVARIRVFHGKGENTVNAKPLSAYFGGKIIEKILLRPFSVTDTSDKYYFSARVTGGGKSGQTDAIVLGVARALAKLSEEKFKPLLRKANLLTRDSREKQRRMVGMGGKSRRKRQSPKR